MSNQFMGKLKYLHQILREKDFVDFLLEDSLGDDERAAYIIRTFTYFKKNQGHWVELELYATHLYSADNAREGSGVYLGEPDNPFLFEEIVKVTQDE